MSVDWNGAGYRAQELLDVLAPAGDECEVPAGVDPEQMSAEVAARPPAGA